MENIEVDSDSEEGVGTFTFDFDVTALKDDVYISPAAVRNTVMNISSARGFNYQIIGASTSTPGVSVSTVQSDAEMVGANYLIKDGSTERFTLVITYEPAHSSSA